MCVVEVTTIFSIGIVMMPSNSSLFKVIFDAIFFGTNAYLYAFSALGQGFLMFNILKFSLCVMVKPSAYLKAVSTTSCLLISGIVFTSFLQEIKNSILQNRREIKVLFYNICGI